MSCCAKKCYLNSNEYSKSLTGLTNLSRGYKLTLSYTPAFLTFTCIHDEECNLFCKYCSPKQPMLIVTLSRFFSWPILKRSLHMIANLHKLSVKVGVCLSVYSFRLDGGISQHSPWLLICSLENSSWICCALAVHAMTTCSHNGAQSQCCLKV